jgi:hypothetical protein
LATKPEAASCSRQTLASSEELGDVAETDANPGGRLIQMISDVVE